MERPGEAVPLASLADRINEEHRACKAALAVTLRHAGEVVDHAMNAGDLLIQAKAEHGKHGEWEDWVRKNVKELSLRRAQEYVYMAERRDELEEAKARGSAFSSLQGALGYLRRARYLPGWTNQPPGAAPLPGPVPVLTDAQHAALGEERLREIKERVDRLECEDEAGRRIGKLLDEAARRGDRERPAEAETLSITAEEWREAVEAKEEIRLHDAGVYLRPIAEHLREVLHPRNGYRPEEAGAALARMGGDEHAIAVLREGVAWLTRVIEAAEAARPYSQRGPLYELRLWGVLRNSGVRGYRMF